MDRVNIQLQDNSGMWRTYGNTVNNSQFILNEMQSLKNRYPNNRVRAIDSNGRMIDMLM